MADAVRQPENDSATNPERAAFLWGLVLPLGLSSLALKIWRIVERGEIETWWATPDLVRSEALLVVGFAAVGWTGFQLVENRIGRRTWLGVLQVVAVGWAVLEVVAHHFFTVTGSMFDLHLLVFTVGRFSEVYDVAASEITVGAGALLGGAVVVLGALPWCIWWWRQKGRGLPDLPKIGEFDAPGPGFCAGVAAVCIVGASLPPLGDDHVAFGRATVVNLALSIPDLRAAEQLEDQIERQPLDDLRLRRTDAAEDGPKNIALVILESTRARSTTVHNPSLETTPHLAELAEESTVAERAYATVTHTSKALVGILCGIEPRLRMPITEYRSDGLPARCLADLLGEQGFSTAFFQSATERYEDRPRLVDNMGYDQFFPLERMDATGYESANYFGREDAVMLPSSRRWLSRRGDEPFFATYLTLSPHHNYDAPRQRYGRFEFTTESDKLNRYLNAVHYVDQFTRELMEQYDDLGYGDDTLFVIVGDHGEAFEEHGRTQHDNVIWQEGVRVPWLIYDPTDPQSERIEYPVSHLDLVPTVLDWMGWESTGGDYPGRPIWETTEDRVVYSHCWYERRCMARIGYRWKYIDHFGGRTPEVYDLLEDPTEQNNLIDRKSDQARRWRAELYGWRESVNAMYRRGLTDSVAEYIRDEVPENIVERTFDLGDYVRYRGYSLEPDELVPGRRVTLTHYFEVLDDIPGGWRLFVHGEPEQGRMMNLDHTPVDGLHPLDAWEPGTVVADEQEFRIPDDPGDAFTLYLGIYHSDEGRFPIRGDVETDGDRRAVVFEEEIQ